MEYTYALLAAIGVAVFNGLAAVLQKVSADKKRLVQTFNFAIILTLLGSWPYLLGTTLDLFAGGLLLLASHSLPLFLVQSLIATSIVFTSIFELIIFKRKITSKKLLAITLVLVGLIMIATATEANKATLASNFFKITLDLALLIIAAVGLWCLKNKTSLAAFGLSAISGICFSMVSVGGRILVYPHPGWHVISNPVIWMIIVYGALGLFFFTTALQRISATSVNSTMVGFQTIVPTVIGIAFLGDTAKRGHWPLVIIGTAIVLLSCIYITMNTQRKTSPAS
jgi:drug/metabolite transporter (DMT)-like permease